MSKTKIIRISLATAENLEKLVKISSGINKIQLLEEAVEVYLRQQFLKKTNEEFARMKQDPELWVAEMEERREWEVTLSDGLQDD